MNTQRQILITPNDLEKYMGKENYKKFLEEIRIRININEDCVEIKKGEPLWIIGEWKGKVDLHF